MWSRLLLAGGIVSMLAGIVGLRGWREAAAEQQAVFAITPPTQTVNLSDGGVSLSVEIRDVTDLAAFEFVLRYDPGVLTDPQPSEGGFLGSSGRRVSCLPPIVDSPSNGQGTVQFGCVTTAQGEGVSGSGVLATVRFRLAGGSWTAVNVERASAVNWLGDSRCPGGSDYCPVRGGEVRVLGGRPESERGLAPTPTPLAGAEETPAPTPGASVREAAGATGSEGGSHDGAVPELSGEATGGARGGSALPGAREGTSGEGTRVGRFGEGRVHRASAPHLYGVMVALGGAGIVMSIVGLDRRRRCTW